MKTKININRIYDIVEAKIAELNGSHPTATETDLGLDSLDMLDISVAVENQIGVGMFLTIAASLQPICHHWK